MAKDFSSGLSSVLAGGAETIVARSTPAGRGGLAVIRISGEKAWDAAAKVCPALDLEVGWTASLVRLIGADGGEIDRAIAVPYPGPRSYTGEDMLEIMVHGSPWIVETTVEAFEAAGARPAAPGEFTRRAVANGKLDLIQAEAINDLSAADTAWQARLARAQARGVLSGRFAELRTALVELLADLEGAIDFSHHEIAFDRDAAAAGRDRCLELTRSLLATAAAGRDVRDGVRVVILGPPNSGKSTLFNLLAGCERAIVSPHAGTTRDVIETEIEVAGLRVVLQDTAGLGPGSDLVEREGVRRAEGAAADADVVVWLCPADCSPEEPPGPADRRPVLRVRSKADLGGEPDPEGWVRLSCRTGEGVETVRRALGSEVAGNVADLGGEVAIASRHRWKLERAAAELEGGDFFEPELAAEAVRLALDEIRELTGEVVTEEVLDQVFRTFCIGK